jgi:hypothetical protein
MDSCDVEMCDQWGASDAPPLRIEGLWLAEELSIATRSKTSSFFLFVFLRGGGGCYVISVIDSGDCAVKGRNLSSVDYQKSVLAFAGLRQHNNLR